MQGDRFFREVMSNCWDPDVRIEEYAKSGVQVQVVCTIPVLFAYWAKPRTRLDIARFSTMTSPGRSRPPYAIMWAWRTLPMQDVDLSIQN